MQWILNNVDDARNALVEVSENLDGQDIAEACEPDPAFLLELSEDFQDREHGSDAEFWGIDEEGVDVCGPEVLEGAVKRQSTSIGDLVCFVRRVRRH
jgi:hypothetical protein